MSKMKSQNVRTISDRLIVPFSLAIIFFSVVLLYLPVRHYGFLNFDDDLYLTANPQVLMGTSPGFFLRALLTPLAGNWQPLTFASHALDVGLLGLDAGRHHLVNVLFHALNAVLFALLILRCGASLPWALAISALFAIHPQRVESVAWISERKDVLSGCLFFLTALAYLRYRHKSTSTGYFLVLILFLGGLLAKPMLVSLPVILLLLDWWPCRRFSHGPRGRASISYLRSAWEKWPFFLIAGIMAVITCLTQIACGSTKNVLPLAMRLETAVVACASYLLKLPAPISLSPFYRHPLQWSWPEIAGSALLLTGCSVVCWFRRKSHPWWLMGWLWFFIMLFPVSGILVQAGDQWMADRYTYLPILGLMIAFAVECTHLGKSHPRTGRIVLGSSVLVIGLFAHATYSYLPVWSSNETLTAQAIRHDGGSWSMRLDHAVALAKSGRGEEAIVEFRSLVSDYPGDSDSLNSLGFALFNFHSAEEALPVLVSAVECDPSNVRARTNLGKAMLACGRSDEALRTWESCIADGSQDPTPYLLSARLRAGMHELKDRTVGLERAQSAVRLSGGTDPAALEVLAESYVSLGKKKEAADIYLRAAEAATQRGLSKEAERLRRQAESLTKGN